AAHAVEGDGSPGGEVADLAEQARLARAGLSRQRQRVPAPDAESHDGITELFELVPALEPGPPAALPQPVSRALEHVGRARRLPAPLDEGRPLAQRELTLDGAEHPLADEHLAVIREGREPAREPGGVAAGEEADAVAPACDGHL